MSKLVFFTDLAFVVFAFSQHFGLYLIGMILLSPLFFLILLGIFGSDSASHMNFHRRYTVSALKYVFIAIWLYFYFSNGLHISIDYLMDNKVPVYSENAGWGGIYVILSVFSVFIVVTSVIYDLIKMSTSSKAFINFIDTKKENKYVRNFLVQRSFGLAILYSMAVIMGLFLLLLVADYFI